MTHIKHTCWPVSRDTGEACVSYYRATHYKLKKRDGETFRSVSVLILLACLVLNWLKARGSHEQPRNYKKIRAIFQHVQYRPEIAIHSSRCWSVVPEEIAFSFLRTRGSVKREWKVTLTRTQRELSHHERLFSYFRDAIFPSCHAGRYIFYIINWSDRRATRSRVDLPISSLHIDTTAGAQYTWC